MSVRHVVVAFVLIANVASCRPSSGQAAGTMPSAAPAVSATAGTIATPSSTTAPSAPPVASVSATAPTPVAFGAKEVEALNAELRNGRVFRMLLLGNMPAVRERHTWVLSEDGRQVTLTCEHGDARSIGSDRPEPPRWYLVASVHFSATKEPSPERWAAEYQRDRVNAVPQVTRQTCIDVGERVTLDCRPARPQVFGPNAYVPVDTRPTKNLPWQPSHRQTLAGLACEVTARAKNPSTNRDPFHYYHFPYHIKPPSLFFRRDGEGVERVVYSGHIQYNELRETAPWTAFDPVLPDHVRDRAPRPSP